MPGMELGKTREAWVSAPEGAPGSMPVQRSPARPRAPDTHNVHNAPHAPYAPFPPIDPPEAGPAKLLLFVGEAIRPDAALTTLLAREGQRCLSLPGPEQALRAAALARFDAVLVDAALVDGRAARAIETLAATHHCPVVVLAEHADEVDEIVALERGADLYLARPLSPRRLRAHLGALLRRRAEAAPAQSTPPLEAAGWTLDAARQRLADGKRCVRLTHAQTALLRCLMASGGHIVPAQTLLAALPQHERLQARSLRVYVHRLRQRLREEGVEGLELEAVRGSGYALTTRFEQVA